MENKWQILERGLKLEQANQIFFPGIIQYFIVIFFSLVFKSLITIQLNSGLSQNWIHLY